VHYLFCDTNSEICQAGRHIQRCIGGISAFLHASDIWYNFDMQTIAERPDPAMFDDDDYVNMLAYARTPEGRAKIAEMQAAIDEELGLLDERHHRQSS
jgi:hypothetical protein